MLGRYVTGQLTTEETHGGCTTVDVYRLFLESRPDLSVTMRAEDVGRWNLARLFN